LKSTTGAGKEGLAVNSLIVAPAAVASNEGIQLGREFEIGAIVQKGADMK